MTKGGVDSPLNFRHDERGVTPEWFYQNPNYKVALPPFLQYSKKQKSKSEK